MKDDLFNQICEKLSDYQDNQIYQNTYLFGSLIHKDGVQFDKKLSDIDLISEFDPKSTYWERWEDVKQTEAPSSHLNLHLLQVLKRIDASNPIVSIVSVSNLELEHGIHKDKAPQFFSQNLFLNVKNGKTSSIGNDYQQKSPELEGAADAIRETQRFRNKFLSIAPSGIRFVEPYNGPDVLPKSLLRCAAQVRFVREKVSFPEKRFDVNEGLIYVLQLLVARRKENRYVDDLLQRVSIRMGGRGETGALEPVDQLLL